MRRLGALEFTVIGDRIRQRSEAYLCDHGLRLDYAGQLNHYDLVVTTSDLIIQDTLRNKPVILVQEGMTDPEDVRFGLVKALRLPRWLAGTATVGLSNAYQYLCVASPGYRHLFINKGCNPSKVVVTGLPNFDHVSSYCQNDFPYRDYVLVATSNARETYKPDDRRVFLKWAYEKAKGRPMIFKLHPNENIARARKEIQAIAPDALVFSEGNTDYMIANCEALVTQYSSCIFVGLALGKECYSYFNMDYLRQLIPIQNGGVSGQIIAEYCIRALERQAHPVTQRTNPQKLRLDKAREGYDANQPG